MADKKKFSSMDLPDVDNVVCSGANNFDFPQYEIPEAEAGTHGGEEASSHAMDRFFSGSRPNRRG